MYRRPIATRSLCNVLYVIICIDPVADVWYMSVLWLPNQHLITCCDFLDHRQWKMGTGAMAPSVTGGHWASVCTKCFTGRRPSTQSHWWKLTAKSWIIRSVEIVTKRFRRGARRSSEVERSLMVRWVVGSILHGMDPLSYFSFQPVLHDWCNKGCGILSCLWDGAYKRTLAVNR